MVFEAARKLRSPHYRSSDFARATGTLAKTDALAARRHQMMTMLVSEKNRLGTAIVAVRSRIEAHIVWLKHELDDLDQCSRQTIRQSPVWREQDDLLRLVLLSTFLLTSSYDAYAGLMAPIRPDQYQFVFNPTILESLRRQLGLTQSGLADRLFLPVNTVSRWETGAATPDAKALAAIYSIAHERGVTPQFFERRASLTEIRKRRTRMLVAWDFQNRGLESSDVSEEWGYMQTYLRICHPSTGSDLQLWAYTSEGQWSVSMPLQNLGFRVRQSWFDANSQMASDVMSACREHPENIVVVFVTDDGNFSELVRNLKQSGADVYVWGTAECSQRLKRSLEDGHFIPADAPFVISECMDVIDELAGEPVNKADFGNLCKQRLDDNDVYPHQVGFSKRNPYGSVLRWLEQRGAVDVVEDTRNPDTVSIRPINR